MGSLNQCNFIGNLGRDAEIRHTPGGEAVSTVSIACTETWNDRQGQKQERTEWVRVVLWGKTAENLGPYLKKGKQIFVSGKFTTRKWQDKHGADQYTTEIRADRVVLLGGGGNGQRRRDEDDPGYQGDLGEERSSQASRPASADQTGPVYDDDIPF